MGPPVMWVSDPFVDSGRGFWAKPEGANPGGTEEPGGRLDRARP
ncbi:conserved hypothetical protein [Frankia sp. Hr75.2]|nr:conserved hypothetical protein [Frankia sp. Hr75.2]